VREGDFKGYSQQKATSIEVAFKFNKTLSSHFLDKENFG